MRRLDKQEMIEKYLKASLLQAKQQNKIKSGEEELLKKDIEAAKERKKEIELLAKDLESNANNPLYVALKTFGEAEGKPYQQELEI